MIDLNDIYSKIAQVFATLQPTYHFGDNAIIHGTLADLPEPDEIATTFTDGDYFAIVEIRKALPLSAGNTALINAEYQWYVTLCHKGKGNIDVTKTRNDMVNDFINAWGEFWSKITGYKTEILDNSLAVHELEKDRNIIAVQFIGVIQHITQWSMQRSRLDG